MRAHVVGLSALALLVGAVAALGDPIPVNQIVAFGDSLTDTGNASIFSGGELPGSGYAYRHVPGVPFQVGEYANPPAPGGPSGLWIDQFATKAGLPDPLPALAGGTNFAVAGAVTGGGFGEVNYQVSTFLNGRSSIPSSNLYSFWAGANDVLNGDNPATAADNLEHNIANLAGDGGKYFLWFNLPLLGEVPAGAGDTTALNAASTAFNNEWMHDITALKAEFPGIVLVGVDIESELNLLLGNPGAYGITNTGSEPQGAALNGYLFSFDGLHPTSFADQFIADVAWADLEAATTPGTGSSVPEPASAAMLLLGVGCAVAAKLKTRRS